MPAYLQFENYGLLSPALSSFGEERKKKWCGCIDAPDAKHLLPLRTKTKRDGARPSRYQINHVTLPVIVSAEQRVRSCSRLFRCPEAGRQDGACVIP
jgi:hypothetical protein